MAVSTGIILVAGGVSAVNEFLHDRSDVAVRMTAATILAGVMFAGIEAIPGLRPFAIGVSVIALISVFVGSVTPGVPSPATQLINSVSGK